MFTGVLLCAATLRHENIDQFLLREWRGRSDGIFLNRFDDQRAGPVMQLSRIWS